DFLRELLDYSKVNYIGYSYGTWLGTWYADTYPDRVDRFVLDSNMNWVDDMQANADSDSHSFQRRRDAMLFPWIARHHDSYGLGTTADAVEQRYEEIRAKLVANTKAGLDTPYGYELDLAVLSPIYTDSGFPEAAEAIVAMGEVAFDEETSATAERRIAAATDGRALSPSARLADARQQAESGEEVIDLGSIGTVVRCNDTPYQTNPQPYLARADRDTRKYSYIGYFNTVPMCAFWPYEQQPRRIDLDNVPTMLMIQSEGDPATATEGAERSHRLTRKHTVMVGVVDEGQHGIYIGGPSACIEQIGDAFVFGGVLPTTMTMCGTTPLPGDSTVHSLDGPFDKYQRRDRHTKPDRANPMLARARTQANQGMF
ncbi:MAG TPA: alpha/beta fold hydrolase, partial [Bacillota bacterium]|nr:alpha/beta fold hydrolase [Bacillota bacterium]